MSTRWTATKKETQHRQLTQQCLKRQQNCCTLEYSYRGRGKYVVSPSYAHLPAGFREPRLSPAALPPVPRESLPLQAPHSRLRPSPPIISYQDIQHSYSYHQHDIYMTSHLFNISQRSTEKINISLATRASTQTPLWGECWVNAVI